MSEDLNLREWLSHPDEDEVLTAPGSAVPEAVAQALRFFCSSSVSDDDWAYARGKVLEDGQLDWFVRELGDLVRSGRLTSEQWRDFTHLTRYEPEAGEQQRQLLALLESTQRLRQASGGRPAS